jgi:hypothetical protein
MVISYLAQASKFSGSSWKSPRPPSGREPAVERDNAQPVRIPPAIEHLEISVDDVDEDAAAHHAVEHVDRLGRVSERAVADDTSHHAPRSQAHPPHGGDWRLLKCGIGTVQRALRDHE